MKRLVKLTAASVAALSLLAGSAMADNATQDPNGAPRAGSSSVGFFGVMLNWFFGTNSVGQIDPDG